MTHDGESDLEFRPLVPASWTDFEELFGPNGACGGCWCMLWHQTQSEFDEHKGEDNHDLMNARVEAGEMPGIIGYVGDEPVGWCAVEPRESYPRLGRSPILRPVDDEPVWSITCLFVAADWRRQGVSVSLLEGAIEHVAEHGGDVVEGYPVDATDEQPPAFVWVGLASAFEQAGFVECARRSETRPIMRYAID